MADLPAPTSSLRSRGALGSRHARRAGCRPSTAAVSPSLAPPSIAGRAKSESSNASSSFAAPQPPLSLRELQAVLRSLVASTSTSAAGSREGDALVRAIDSDATLPPALRDATLPPGGQEEDEVPREVIDVDAEDDDDVVVSTQEQRSHESTATAATEAHLCAVIPPLLSRVDAEVRDLLMELWEGRATANEFVAQVRTLQLNTRVGFELPLQEFKASVAALAAQVASRELDATSAHYVVRTLAVQLGPEMNRQVQELQEDVPRADFAGFHSTVKQLQRPAGNTVSPAYQHSATQAMLEAEVRLGFQPYLESFQPEVTPRVRHILVDWLMDVTARYRFSDETLHLSVSLVDRFFAVCPVQRVNVQLVGVSAMFLAAKYEEIYPPDVHDLVGMTANTYTKEDILMTERQIFAKLAFRVTMPSSFAFSQAILAEQDPMPTPLQRHMVSYLIEAMLHVAVYGEYRPSRVATAAVYISRVWCALPTPTPTPEILDVIPVVINAVLRTQRMIARCPAHRNKFASSRYERVSLQPLPVAHLEEAINLQLLPDASQASLTPASQQEHHQPQPSCQPNHHTSPFSSNGGAVPLHPRSDNVVMPPTGGASYQCVTTAQPVVARSFGGQMPLTSYGGSTNRF